MKNLKSRCIFLGVLVTFICGCTANVGAPTEIFNKTDLEISESNPKVVGVKKHKNYEIVVYEYDDSDEERKTDNESSNAPPVEEINDNSVEFPVLDHPTPSTSTPRKSSKSRRVTSTTSTTTTTETPPDIEEDPLEESASEEASTSIESTEESKEVPSEPVKPDPSPKPTSTTSRPSLPKPFRSTKAPKKSKKTSSEEYEDDDDDYSDESDSSFDDYYYGKRRNKPSKESSSKRIEGSRSKLPRRFGGKEDEGDSLDDEYDVLPSRRQPGRKPATSRPLRRPVSNGRVTPKPFFPFIYDDSDEEYVYDDDNEITSTTKRPAQKAKGRTGGKVDNAVKLRSKSKYNNGTDEEDSEMEDAWGIEPSLKCEDPTGKKGVCQEYSRCSIFYQELVDDYDEPVDPAEYKCRLPTQIGICCPLVSAEDVVQDGKYVKMI